MDTARSTGYSAVAVAPASLGRGLIRWAVLGAAGVIALILALSHSMAAGAAAPVTYDTNCIAINYTTCVPSVGYVAPTNGYVAPGYGTFNGNIVATNLDPRYCGGVVYVVNEGGNLIDRCPDGTRVVPVFPDYGFAGLYGNGFIGANYLNGFVNNGFVCNGLYGCPGAFNNGVFNNGIFNGAFPAGATNIGGGVFTYMDNRFCGDGKLFFVVGRGSFCQNGQALNGNGIFNPGFVNGNFYRFFEVTPTTPTTQEPAATVAQPATTAPAAAPVTAAPIAAPTTQVAAPAAVPQAPAAAPAQMVTALTAPQVQTPDAAPTGGGGVHILSAPPATTPAATTDPDDHKG
jgi:hypothetical protein